jgi:hyperosmotically inducible protein
MMRSTKMGLGLAFATMVALGAYGVQAQQPGTGETIGEKIDDAAAAVRRGVDKAGDAVKGQYARVKASVHSMGVEGRVYGRLHWDKSLQNATIDVSVSKDGTATLTGSVASLTAKTTAVDLATRTVGVERVVDQLAVAIPTTQP